MSPSTLTQDAQQEAHLLVQRWTLPQRGEVRLREAKLWQNQRLPQRRTQHIFAEIE